MANPESPQMIKDVFRSLPTDAGSRSVLKPNPKYIYKSNRVYTSEQAAFMTLNSRTAVYSISGPILVESMWSERNVIQIWTEFQKQKLNYKLDECEFMKIIYSIWIAE